MNKYTLYFKDQEVEEKFQSINQKEFRMFTLSVVTFGFMIVCVAKLIEQLVAGVYNNVIMYIIIISYLVIQYWIARKYQHIIRITLLLLNHIFTLFFNLQVEDSGDFYYAYLRGANVMGANFLVFVSGEYVDAFFSAFSTAIIRIVIVLLKSGKIEFSSLMSTFIVALCVCRYLYHFYKATRSQYLLSLNDSHWEKVLNSIAFKQPYLLFSFMEENLNFQLKQEGQCSQFFNRQFEGLSFLKDSNYKGNKLEYFIYQQIKKFRVDRASVFNRTLVVEYLKKLVRIECSIFYGNKPSVLILLRDYLKEKKIDLTLYEKRHRNFTKLFVKVLGNCEKHQQPIIQLKYLQRKIIQLQLLDDMKLGKLKQAQLSLFVIANFLNNLYPQIAVRAVVDGDPNLQTIPNLMFLIMLFIAENTKSQSLFLCLNENYGKTRSLTIKGQFDVTKFQSETSWLTDYLRLIIQMQKIEQCNIYFLFNSQILIPFYLSEIALKSSKRIEI